MRQLFSRLGREIPPNLLDWEGRVTSWCDAYIVQFPRGSISEVSLDCAVYLFDDHFERVTLAYALSVEQLMVRDANRMRGFPDAGVSADRSLRENIFPVDRGHFLGHASGGILDINVFPQRRDLNRGWSSDGKRFRKMERFVAEHPGTFFYHRPCYDDETWIPRSLDYGVLIEDTKWWVATFRNKSPEDYS